MSQLGLDVVDPAISGDALADDLNKMKAAFVSGLSGTSRPAEVTAGGWWVDTTNDPTSWSFKMYTGAADVEVFKLFLSTGIASTGNANSEFDIQRVSADTTGAILKLIKQRILTNGQVKDGDVVGELRFIGRANDASNPLVAKMIWTATDDQTTSAYGGTLSFQSTPDGSATLIEHMRFINGMVETVLPHKLNSLRLVGQNIATAASIAQLDATKVLVEFTGSTATNLQGVNSGQDTQLINLHNRSSVNVTLKHQDAGAAAADRMKLPTSSDYVLIPDASVTLYYCTTDTRWKLLSTSDKSFSGYSVETFTGVTNTFVAKTSIVRVRAYTKRKGTQINSSGMLDTFGSAYMWGFNASAQLGVGDLNARSSPVAVIGGNTFIRLHTGDGGAYFGLRSDGAAYSWGGNPSGALGVGDVVGRSSPVAILGGQKWSQITAGNSITYGLTTAGVPYAWGRQDNGQLGVGDVIPRSSPVAVLGGLIFQKLVAGGSASASAAAITKAGALYTWGLNDKGQLGLGDLIPRSSPVAVLGGFTFSEVLQISAGSFLGLTTSGTLYAWGRNDSGYLGVGDILPRSSPVAVLGGITFKQIFSSYSSTQFMALSTGGVLYAWGANDKGQLGVGDAINRSSPVAVVGGLTFNKVYVSGAQTIALDATGVAYAWGANSAGILGVGDVVARSSPVAVLGGFTFEHIVFPYLSNSVFGVQADGTMYAWGDNAQGTLALADTVPRSSPVAVVGGLRADNTQPSFSADLTLTIGQSYTINIADGGMATFNAQPLGLNIGRVEIEYLQ